MSTEKEGQSKTKTITREKQIGEHVIIYEWIKVFMYVKVYVRLFKCMYMYMRVSDNSAIYLLTRKTTSLIIKSKR